MGLPLIQWRLTTLLLLLMSRVQHRSPYDIMCTSWLDDVMRLSFETTNKISQVSSVYDKIESMKISCWKLETIHNNVPQYRLDDYDFSSASFSLVELKKNRIIVVVMKFE